MKLTSLVDSREQKPLVGSRPDGEATQGQTRLVPFASYKGQPVETVTQDH